MMVAPATSQTRPVMTIQDSVRQCLRKYADFSGRATRAEFWWWVLATAIASLAVSVVDRVIDVLIAFVVGFGLSPFTAIFALAILLPNLAVTARRLHDIGRTGWWQLVWYVIAFVGTIPLIAGLVITIIWVFAGESFSIGIAEEFLGENPIGVWVPLVVGGLITLAIYAALFVWMLIWMIKQGQGGFNRFGPDPRAWDTSSPAQPVVE